MSYPKTASISNRSSQKREGTTCREVDASFGALMAEDSAIRELAERLLAHPISFGPMPTVRLLPGELPESPELSLMPPGARVIGTLVREPGFETERDYEVVLDAPGNEKEIIGFYEKRLGELGLKRRDEMFGPGGFMPGPMGEGRIFQREGSDIGIMLAVQPRGDSGFDVRLRTQFFPSDRMVHRPPHHDVIPALRPPPEVRLMGMGSGGSDRSWTSTATAETSKSVSELESHFAQQLSEKGWTRLNGSASGPLAWSSWRLPSEWQGYLIVVEAPGTDRRSLWVQVESTSGGRGSRAGWSGYGPTSTASRL